MREQHILIAESDFFGTTMMLVYGRQLTGGVVLGAQLRSVIVQLIKNLSISLRGY